MQKTIELNHLVFTHNGSLEPHEFDPTDVSHPCMAWCAAVDMNVKFYMELQEVETSDDKWDIVWSQDPKVFATFESDDDIILFMLRWSEDEEHS